MNALAEAGATIRGNAVKCPWHGDKQASGGIYQDSTGDWRYRCQVPTCGVAGDVWDIEARNRGYASTNDYLHVFAQAQPKPNRPPSRSAKTPKIGPESKNGSGGGYNHLWQVESSLAAKFGRFSYRFEYHNPALGRPDFWVYRFDHPNNGKNKEFRPVHKNGCGYVVGAPAKPWPLYHLELIADAERVVVTEGEKAAEALIVFGVVATTAPSGAGNAANADWSPLSGKQVILWPDKDDAGERHMDEIEKMLSHLSPAPIVYRLRDVPVPSKGDAYDFVDVPNGEWHQLSEALYTLLDEAEPVGPSKELRALIDDTVSGKRQAVQWPWQGLGNATQALLPGTITLVCGRPGSAKSFWLLQALIAWHQADYRVAVYELEEKRDYHLNRVLAQLEGNGNLTNTDWVKENPKRTWDAFERHQQTIDGFGPYLWDMSSDDLTQAQLVEWAEARAKDGCRIVAIDPVTAVQANHKPWMADQTFINGIKRVAEQYAISVIIVTHPKQGVVGRPHQDSLAGGASYQRLSQTVLWLEHLQQKKKLEIDSGMGTIAQDCTHLLHILKARNGTGANRNVAFEFENLRFIEKGIVSLKKDND